MTNQMSQNRVTPRAVYLHEIDYALGASRVDAEMMQADNPHWDFRRLQRKTGVDSLPVARPGETALDMGVTAAQKLFEENHIKKEAVDGLIFCTESPDHLIPPNSCIAQDRLGLRRDILAFDVGLACSGFTHSLTLTKSLIGSGQLNAVLLLLGDTYSHHIHPQDRSVRPIFGDGVCAALLSAQPGKYELLDCDYGTDGSGYRNFFVESGGARQRQRVENATRLDHSGTMKSRNHIQMDGKAMLDFFSREVPLSIEKLLERNGCELSDIDHFIFHQASTVILERLRLALGIDAERLHQKMHDTGNLVSASVPVALKIVEEEGKIKPDQTILLCGFGAGLSWSSMLLRSQDSA